MIGRGAFIVRAGAAIASTALVSLPAAAGAAAAAPAEGAAFKIVGWDDPDEAAAEQSWLIINRSQRIAWR
jgi:hypothetical protein